MEAEKIYLTEDGAKKLREELDYLIHVRRPEVAQHIHDAKADGDISENAGYDEAKNEQAFVEGRIAKIQQILKHAVIVDQAGDSDTVQIGHEVAIREVGTDEEEIYTIVGSAEIDPSNGKISHKSPLGSALMGKKVGDRVAVKTPGGIVHFEVLRIK
jgi:transcription elongation factor GreA